MSELVKVALVTGSGKGIGRAIAIRLAEKGFFAAINYNSSEKAAAETLAQIESAGGKGMVIQCDVSSPEQVQEMFKKITEKAGPVEVLVCNAGITKDSLLMRMKEEDWDRVISSNLKSLFLCAKEAVRPMLKNKSGRIIAISSVSGIAGNAGQCNYAASKAGMAGFVKSLAREVAAKGITVNAVAPGFIETDMTASLSQEIRDQFLKGIPSGRIGAPEDVANLVAFLASEEASYIQGQVIAVDGGMTM